MSDERIAHELLDALPITCTTLEIVVLGTKPTPCGEPAELIVHFTCPIGGHTHQQAICRTHRDKLMTGRQRVACPRCALNGRTLVPLTPQREELLRARPS
jgi:hypothetical protein